MGTDKLLLYVYLRQSKEQIKKSKSLIPKSKLWNNVDLDDWLFSSHTSLFSGGWEIEAMEQYC